MLQLTVEDADHGPNSQVTFSINTDRFAVNSSTGILYTTQPLDREEQAHYHLTVQATDGGGEAAKVTDCKLGCLNFGRRFSEVLNSYSASTQISVLLNTRIFNIRYWILHCQTCERYI